MKNAIQSALFFFLFLFFCSCDLNSISENEVFKIEFRKISADSIGFMDPFVSPARPMKDGRFLENIKKYPLNFELLSTYQFDAQYNTKLSELFLNDSSFREMHMKNISHNQIDFWTKLSNTSSFDCIISACEIEDESGNRFFVFDSNNDEDMSNDSLITFKNFDNQFSVQHKNLSYRMAESSVKVEFFDGEKISDEILLLSFVKQTKGNRSIKFLSNRKINAGYANFNGQKYLTMIRNRPPDINFNKYGDLWIDLNKNNKCDSDSDFSEQMLSPFTLFGSSYRVKQVDLFGNYIYLEKLNPSQYPPIQVGFPAPDFQFSLNDSSDFQLSNYKGRYILLDFWSCNSFYCNSMILELSNKYNDRNNLQIISCALDSISYDSFRKTQVKNEDDNRIFISGPEIEKVRSLYQQTAVNKLVLISPDFKIISIEKFMSKETEKLLADLL